MESDARLKSAEVEIARLQREIARVREKEEETISRRGDEGRKSGGDFEDETRVQLQVCQS